MILGGRYAAFTFILQKNRKQSLLVQCAIIVLHLTKSFAAWRRVAVAVFRQRSVASDSARAVSALPYSANRRYCIVQLCYADSGVSPRPCSAKMRYCIAQLCYADSRLVLPAVILSRRACGASKNLLRLPRSGYNEIMPAFLYTNSTVTLQDPSTSCLAICLALRSG